MIRNVRLAVAALVAVSALTVSAQAQTKPFKIRGTGVAPEGLPLPGQEAREHSIVGNATELGRHTGLGTVATDSAVVDSAAGTISGEFGGGSEYTFVAANGDKLVCWYGRTDHGAAAPGTFELTIVGSTEGGDLIVDSEFFAEFVVQTEQCTGRFAKASGSWMMRAFSLEPWVLGSSDPIFYGWEGEGELEFVKGK
jgi:hypothetical protein